MRPNILPWTVRASVCGAPDATGGASFTGTGTLTAPRHDSAAVDLTGVIGALSGTTTIGFTVSARGGSGELRGAAGSISVTGTFDWSTGTFTATTSGTITST